MAMITERFREQSFAGEWRGSLHSLPQAAGLSFVGNLVTNLLIWLDRARERRQLLSLSDRALQDFARSRADALSEGCKPFWKA